MSELTQKAKDLLAQITPGEWKQDDTEEGGLVVRPLDVEQWICSFGYMDEVESDDLYNAEFIAAAPGLVKGLLAENEVLQAELAALKGAIKFLAEFDEDITLSFGYKHLTVINNNAGRLFIIEYKDNDPDNATVALVEAVEVLKNKSN